MANLNKVMLIGRLTRDPEMRTFANGGKVAQFGFAVNNKKKNQQTGTWEDEAVFLDCKAFNRETGRKLADLVEQFFTKGKQFYLEGHLVLEQWTSQQDGQKRSKLVIVMDDFQFLDAKQDGQGGSSGGYSTGASRPAAAPMRQPAPTANYAEESPDYQETPEFASDQQTDKDIPF